jgi:RHS repeat-associated protein
VQGGTLVKGTVPLPGGATAIYSGTTSMPYIRHLDWLGSSRLATTWSHTVQSKVAYAPFGETYNVAGASSNDRSFTGQDQDTVTGSPATGIYDYMFRKYDPAAGRWLSPDPSGWDATSQDTPQSLNRYAYSLNNPLSLIDPNGLSCVYGWVVINGVSVSTVGDDNDGQGCAEAGVPPGGGPGNDGQQKVTVHGNPPCTGDPNCVTVNPPPDCDSQCLLSYSNTISQLQSEGYQVNVPLLPPTAPNNGTKSPSCGKAWGKAIAGTLLDATGLIPGEGTIASGIKIAGTLGGIALSASGSFQDAAAGGVFTGVSMYADATKQDIQTLGKDVAEGIPGLGTIVSGVAVVWDLGSGAKSIYNCYQGVTE